MIINCMPSGYIAANTYLVVDEATNKGFVVDPGGYNRKLVEEIKNNNYDIGYIVLTHGHDDHIGGIPDLMEQFSGLKIVAAEAELPMLKDPVLNMSVELGGKEVSITPDITVNDGDTMEIGNMELKFLMTPGHTPGGMCILIDNCLFSGDTLFRQSIGRTDFPGGSFQEIKASIQDKLYVLPDDTQVYPGHMGPTNIGFEKGNNPFVFV